jgi:hypothetical protein
MRIILCKCMFRGGRDENRILTLVLKGNNPRFPRMKTMPSAAKLAHRLTGTIERPGSTETLDKYPPPGTSRPGTCSDQSPRTQDDLATHFRPPRRGAAPGELARILRAGEFVVVGGV